MRRIYIPGFGYQLIETKNPFRKRKMFDCSLKNVFADLGLPLTITPSQETDMC